MATFSEVKQVLDSLVAGQDPVRLRNRHGGGGFDWSTAQALRAAVVQFPGETFRLIDPTLIGNGRADETYLMRILAGRLGPEDYPRMPFRGPYAAAAQMAIIRDWINGGALDDPASRGCV